jgi:hypothetical protein
MANAQAAIRGLRQEDVRVLVTVAPDHAAELGEELLSNVGDGRDQAAAA